MPREPDPTVWRVNRAGPALLLVPLALLLVGIACQRESANTANPKPLAIVISGDTAGWITPCGCASNQSGGLLRRGTYVARLGANAAVEYADVGGAAGGDSDYHKVKFEAILAGEQRMGVVAHNIGKSEAAMGADYLRDAGRRLGAPFVSANVRDAAGKPIAEAFRIAPAGGRRVCFVGVLSPQLAPPNLAVTDPKQAILAAAGVAKGQYDSLVVLAYLPQDELEQLAGSLPEADAVVGGPTGQAISPRQMGPTLLAAATNKGKFLVELHPPAGATAGGWEGKVVEMSAALADEPEQLAGVKTYLAELERRDLAAAQSGLVAPVPPGTPADYRVAGSESCLSCHQADHAAWHASKHAHAWETIRAKGFHVDSACQQCHTTGFSLPGGFESRKTSAARVDVGCENCHGPALAHANQPATHTPFVAADQCVRCHDHENSPAFEFKAYWGRIVHGSKAKPREGDQSP